MADHDDPLAKAPAMPVVPATELYAGSPYLLVDSGVRHSLGWQEHGKSGPSFVVVTKTAAGRSKVLQRFPLTEQGWEQAWGRLAGLDAAAAAAVSEQLAKRAGRRNAASALAELDARSLGSLRYVSYTGGSGDVQLAKGTSYDVRFLADRIAVCPSRSASALADLPYADVEAVEITEPDRTSSSGQAGLIALGLALLGALLGLLVLGLLGLLLGALFFGLIGAAVGSAAAKIETTIRIRGRDAELYFVTTAKRADPLRIELSEPLREIDKARLAPAGEPGGQQDAASAGSVPDQLSKLAALLQQDLITRAEFDRLKADLIAKPVSLDKDSLAGD